jgi:RNA polymerase sigma-70 factor (ECF subfamily)
VKGVGHNLVASNPDRGFRTSQMNSTSISLLRRLREPSPEPAWQRFVDLYAPLIFHWGRRQGLNGTDAGDLVQEVLTVLIVKLPDFQYDPTQRFRGWLRTVTLNKVRDFQRRKSSQPLLSQHQIPDLPAGDAVDLFEEVEYQKYLIRRALELMQSDFQETTWKACWNQIVDGRSAQEVGLELGISANAAHVAKCRVLKRLREELAELMG